MRLSQKGTWKRDKWCNLSNDSFSVKSCEWRNFNSIKDRLFCKWFKSKNLVDGGSRVGFLLFCIYLCLILKEIVSHLKITRGPLRNFKKKTLRTRVIFKFCNNSVTLHLLTISHLDSFQKGHLVEDQYCFQPEQ